ncbi:MAG: hypothetical protein SH809_05985 [Rhodothermales bacterium]|nr:hypothetical protein [Rhodothermales bacterium]
MNRLFLILLILPAATGAYAQEAGEADSLATAYGTGAGLEVVITNSGFGLGAYVNGAIGTRTSLAVDLNIGSEKSEREVKFIGIGQNFIPDKANYFLRIPVRLGIQRRLWKEHIEDNFRPYTQFTFGPTLGWVYPYFDDDNDNGSYDSGERRYEGFGSLLKGELRFGIGGMVGLGAHFGESTRVAQGMRVGYSFNYFFDPIQLLEIDEATTPARFFGTPSISITFGRLF